MNWKHGIVALGVLLVAGILIASSGSAEDAEFDEATVHLSPNCNCCTGHVQHLERAGADIKVVEHSNHELQQIYKRHGIPENYWSCHLTEMDDYVIKGHVPVDVFNEVVEEEPDADAVVLPGMPSGSPGMPGSKSEEWQFFKISEGNVKGEFTTR